MTDTTAIEEPDHDDHDHEHSADHPAGERAGVQSGRAGEQREAAVKPAEQGVTLTEDPPRPEAVAAQVIEADAPAFVADAVEPAPTDSPDGLHTMKVREGGADAGKRDFRLCPRPTAGERYWRKDDAGTWAEVVYRPDSVS